MPPGHAGHRHHAHRHHEGGETRLGIAIAVNAGLTVAQVVGGMLSGSLALIADALHNFSDAASLVIALAARRIARRPADPSMTFGYGRAEIVAALINFTTLILIGLWLGYEAAMRILDPQPIEGWTVVIVASLALVVDTVTAALTYALSRESMNIRAAFLHNLTDAAASVAVILGGLVVLVWDWTLIDPILTLAIAAYVVWHGARELRGAIRILMNAAPQGMETREVARAMASVEGVADVHHVHLWRFDEKRVSLEAHVVLAAGSGDPADVKASIRRVLERRYGIRHVTLETERPDEICHDRGSISV